MWKPFLDGASAERAVDAVEAIAEALSATVDRLENDSLAVGLCGPALFFADLSQARSSERFLEASAVCLERAMDFVARRRLTPSLFEGFCGVGWTIEQLRPWLFNEDDDPLAALDEVLIDFLERPSPVELMHGLAGIGLYLLERLPDPSARRALEALLDRLEDGAERRDERVTWPSQAGGRSEAEDRSRWQRFYNLGVAHGVPGVIGFLAGLRRAGVEPERCEKLADGAVRWLLEKRLPEGGVCRFPTTVGPGIAPEPSRTAWCSGDLGIAAVLDLAGRAFERSEWTAEALALARLAARRPPDDTGVNDSSLCHGAAGLGHLFLRLHRSTGDLELGEAARFWLGRTLEMGRPGDGLAGFSTWSGDGRGGVIWRRDPGFLTGVAGIGLALLAAVSDVEPSWDRVLLLS